MESNANGDFLI